MRRKKPKDIGWSEAAGGSRKGHLNMRLLSWVGHEGSNGNTRMQTKILVCIILFPLLPSWPTQLILSWHHGSMRLLVSKIGEALRRHPSKQLRLLDKVWVRQIRAKKGTNIGDHINPTYHCKLIGQDDAPMNTVLTHYSLRWLSGLMTYSRSTKSSPSPSVPGRLLPCLP